MAQTRWSGGKTGSESMPEGTVSMYYSEVFNEVPRLYRETATHANGYGYYEGTPLPYPEHATLYAYRSESLSATVSGQEVTINETSPSSGYFKITDNVSGWVRINYLPFSDSLYFSKKTSNKLILTAAHSRITPTKRQHIDEILTAIEEISKALNTVRRRFSIKPYTGVPTHFEPSIGVEPVTPVIKQLFQEIGSNLIYLFNYAVTSVSAPVVPDDIYSYTSEYVTLTAIEGFRSDINILESALIDLGVM